MAIRPSSVLRVAWIAALIAFPFFCAWWAGRHQIGGWKGFYQYQGFLFGSGLSFFALFVVFAARRLFRHASRWMAIAISVAFVILVAGGFVWLRQQVRENEIAWDRRNLLFQFTASAAAVAFPVPLYDEFGLVIVDRTTGQHRLIGEHGFLFLYPQFSSDGARLLMTRQRRGESPHELLSCEVATWQCRVISKVDHYRYSWPLELDNGKVVFVATGLAYRWVQSGWREGPSSSDFYTPDGVNRMRQLTNFGAWLLGPFAIVEGNIVFGRGRGPLDDEVASKSGIAEHKSEIFRLRFDPNSVTIEQPRSQLAPEPFPVAGVANYPAVSADGKRIAFLAWSGNDLGVATLDGKLIRQIPKSGVNFSRPVFVGEELLANELFDDRYEIKSFDVDGELRHVSTLRNSPKFLEGLPVVTLSITE